MNDNDLSPLLSRYLFHLKDIFDDPELGQGKIVAYSLNAWEDGAYHAIEYGIQWNDGSMSYIGFQVLNGCVFTYRRPRRSSVFLRHNKPPQVSFFDAEKGKKEVDLTPA